MSQTRKSHIPSHVEKPTGSIAQSKELSSKKSKSIKNSGSPRGLIQSQQLRGGGRKELDEFSQAVELTNSKFNQLILSTDPGKKSKRPGELPGIDPEVVEKCFDMIENMFEQIGGQQAVKAYVSSRCPDLLPADNQSM